MHKRRLYDSDSDKDELPPPPCKRICTTLAASQQIVALSHLMWTIVMPNVFDMTTTFVVGSDRSKTTWDESLQRLRDDESRLETMHADAATLAFAAIGDVFFPLAELVTARLIHGRAYAIYDAVRQLVAAGFIRIAIRISAGLTRTALFPRKSPHMPSDCTILYHMIRIDKPTADAIVTGMGLTRHDIAGSDIFAVACENWASVSEVIWLAARFDLNSADFDDISYEFPHSHFLTAACRNRITNEVMDWLLTGPRFSMVPIRKNRELVRRVFRTVLRRYQRSSTLDIVCALEIKAEESVVWLNELCQRNDTLALYDWTWLLTEAGVTFEVVHATPRVAAAFWALTLCCGKIRCQRTFAMFDMNPFDFVSADDVMRRIENPNVYMRAGDLICQCARLALTWSQPLYRKW